MFVLEMPLRGVLTTWAEVTSYSSEQFATHCIVETVTSAFFFFRPSISGSRTTCMPPSSLCRVHSRELDWTPYCLQLLLRTISWARSGCAFSSSTTRLGTTATV